MFSIEKLKLSRLLLRFASLPSRSNSSKISEFKIDDSDFTVVSFISSSLGYIEST